MFEKKKNFSGLLRAPNWGQIEGKKKFPDLCDGIQGLQKGGGGKKREKKNYNSNN